MTKWTAVIYLGIRAPHRYKRYYVSTLYQTAVEAAKGYDRAAIAIFGPELASTNFPIDSYGHEVQVPIPIPMLFETCFTITLQSCKGQISRSCTIKQVVKFWLQLSL